MESLYSKPVTAENPRISNRSIFLEYPKRIEQDTIVMFLDIVLKGLKPNYTVNNTNDSNKTWVVIDLPQGDKYVSKTGYTNFIYKKTQPVIHTLTQGNVKKLKALILPPSDKIINKPVKAVIPIPLPYIDYMVKCPEIPLREEITTGSTYKSLKQEVDSLIPGVHADIGVTAAMLTAELYPSTLTLASAWEVIPYLEQHIIDILSSFEDIKYIASTIEVHTNKPPSKSKSKTEPPTKSKFKPKTKGSDEEQVEDITRVRKALDQQEETLTKVKKMAKCTEKAKEKVRIEMEEAQEKEEEQAKQLLAKGIVLEVADPDSKKGYLQSLAKEERKQKRIESIAKSLYNDLNNSDSKSSDNKQPKKKKKVAVVNKESDSEEETKVNVIVINKANNQEDEDKKRELPKVTDSNRYVHSLLTGTKTKKDITSEEYVQEILRVFTTYNEDLKVTLKSGLLMEEGYQRAISFAKLNKIIKEKTKKDNVSLLTTYAEEIYEKLREIGSTLITSIGTIQYSSGIPPPTKLLGLPHLHMLLARTKNTKLGEYNENSDYFNALRFPNTIFGDIYIEDHHSVISTRDNKGRPGGKVSMDDANILTYIIKNSDYKEAVPRLNRYPFTLYNIRKIEKVNNLYNYIARYNKVTIRGLIKTDIVVPPIRAHVKPKDKKTTKLVDAIDRIVALMNQNKLALHFPRTDTKEVEVEVWSKVEGSKNTWTNEMTLNNLWGYITNGDNKDICPFEGEIMKLINTSTNDDFPRVEIDYQMIEFKDFFYHLTTGTTTSVSTYPSFYYNDKICLDDVATLDTFKSHNPTLWLNILRNSGYIDKEDIPIRRGKELLKDLYNSYRLKTHKVKCALLYGGSNACKSSLIGGTLGIYPPEVVANIRKAGDFCLEVALGKEVLFLDEYSHKNSGLSNDTFKAMVSGDQDSANRKGKKVINTVVIARCLINCDDIHCFYDKEDDTEKKTDGEEAPIPTLKSQLKKANEIMHNDSNNKLPKGDHYGDKRHEENMTKVGSVYTNRINFYYLISMPKKSIIDGVKTDIEEKLAGNICMYLALHYFGKLAHTDDPKQLEEIITKSKVGTLQFKRKFKKRKIIYAGRQTDI